jgi:hypothetical protein
MSYEGFYHLTVKLVDGADHPHDDLFKVEIYRSAEFRRVYFNVVF